MGKFMVNYTLIYNGYAEVEAEDREEAQEMAREILNNADLSAFPCEVELKDNNGEHVGSFDYGEVTMDYIEDMEN